MKLYVERGDRIASAGDGADVLAHVRRVNPLAGEPVLDGLGAFDSPGGAPRVVTWSGSLGDALFEPHPANWLRPGQDALREACLAMAPQLAARGMTACFHPHCRHVLSDAPSCVTFLDAMAGEPFEVALAPASMLEPSMMADAADHLRRMFEMLGGRAAMVILSDVAEGSDGRLEQVPLGLGRLPRELVMALLREHVPAGKPIVLEDREMDVQREWLC